MLILVESLTADGQAFGIGSYAKAIMRHLPAVRPDWDWHLITHRAPEKDTSAFTIHGIPDDLPAIALQEKIAAIAAALKPDVFHSLYYSVPPPDCNSIISVQDTIPDMGFAEFETETFIEKRTKYCHLLSRYDHILSSSNHTAKCLRNLYPSTNGRISVAELGVDFLAKTHKTDPSISVKYCIHNPFILLPAHSTTSYKNVETAVEGIMQAARTFWPEIRIVSTGMNFPETSDIWVQLPRISREDYLSILASANALICPSLDEGFGLPVLEAMALKVPVICADAGALPEVAGNAAIYFNPSEPSDVCRALRQLHSSNSSTDRLTRLGSERARTFTWENCAKKTIEAYKALTSNRPPMQARHPIFPVTKYPPASRLDTPGRLASFKRRLSYYPNNPDTLRELGKIYKEMNDLGKARECFEMMLFLIRRHGHKGEHLRSALYHLGDCLHRQGEDKLAASHLNECLSLFPNHEAAERTLRNIKATVKPSGADDTDKRPSIA